MGGHGSALGIVLLTTVLAILAPTCRVAAQSTDQPWPQGGFVAASGFGLLWTEDESYFTALGGFGLQFGSLNPSGLGFEVLTAFFPPTGRYGVTGVSAVLGVAHSLPLKSMLVQIKGGATGIFGGDSDGTPLIGGGPYAGAGVVHRLGGRFAASVDFLLRVYQTGDGRVAAPSASVGLVLLSH